MTMRFRAYYQPEDRWLYFEADDEGTVTRQIETSAVDGKALMASSLADVLELRDLGAWDELQAYERRYGVVAEVPVSYWLDRPQAVNVTPDEFELVWATARARLDSAAA